MAVTVEELIHELKWVLQDPSTEAHLPEIVRGERLALASEYELPRLKLHQPVSGTVTTANWLYDLPPTYQKKVFRARSSVNGEHWLMPIYRNIAAIDLMDPEHTATGERVSMLAVEGTHFAVYPKADDTILLWFWARPDVEGDIDELPPEWAIPVLLPRCVLRAFRLFPELARSDISENRLSLDLWRTKQREAIYGGPMTGSIGYLNTILKDRPPVVRGGHPGHMLP